MRTLRAVVNAVRLWAAILLLWVVVKLLPRDLDPAIRRVIERALEGDR